MINSVEMFIACIRYLTKGQVLLCMQIALLLLGVAFICDLIDN